MKNKFLQVCLGISAVMVSASLFVCSITPAKASTPDKFPTPDKFDGGNTMGRYAIDYTMMHTTDSGQQIYLQEAIVYDTQTGKSVQYEDIGQGWKKVEHQLPASPMGN